jgi:ribose/xylose/arabinose/galactoside ABC-type transport system permease subunit
MSEIGRLLIGLGLLLLVLGGIILLLGKTGIPLGRLPGDISWRGKNFAFYFPLGTCILISIVLSALFYLLSRFRR